MELIPKNCIQSFETKFKTQPSIFELTGKKPESVLKNFFKKSYLIWFYTKIGNEGNVESDERLMEYDSSGIMVYIKNWDEVFILTTVDRLNVAEFTIQNLKRLTK